MLREGGFGVPRAGSPLSTSSWLFGSTCSFQQTLVTSPEAQRLVRGSWALEGMGGTGLGGGTDPTHPVSPSHGQHSWQV